MVLMSSGVLCRSIARLIVIVNDFSVFHFGASTRNYVIRERPQTGARPVMEEIEKTSMTAEGDKGAALLGMFTIKFLSK